MLPFTGKQGYLGGHGVAVGWWERQQGKIVDTGRVPGGGCFGIVKKGRFCWGFGFAQSRNGAEAVRVVELNAVSVGFRNFGHPGEALFVRLGPGVEALS